MEEYENVLKKLKKEELEEFIMDTIMQYPNIREDFEMYFSKQFPKKSEEEIKLQIRRALIQVTDDGVISDEMGYLAMHVIYNYTQQVIKYVEDDNIVEAITLIKALMEVVDEFYIDGSNGEQSDLINDFNEDIEMILEKASDAQKDEFLEWLKAYIQGSKEFVDYKDELNVVYDKYSSK